ncbi:MAG: dihydropteroate synthase, partial [Rhodoglobus sp.]|nr:dihydropteroate synthase [Rhodoglobus sp.]
SYYIAMHWRGSPTDMDDLATYDDVVVDVREELKARLGEMIVSGVDPARVILDPGLGFAKRPEHNWQLLGRLDELASLGHPILVGASRKRFLSPWGDEPAQRDSATAIVSALAATAGIWGVRVHDVPTNRVALDIHEAWQNGRNS